MNQINSSRRMLKKTVQQGPSNSLFLSLGERPRLSFTARIERAQFHRARSASKEGTWPLPPLLADFFSILLESRPHVCLSCPHDSGIRHSLFAPVGGDRTDCCQAGPHHERFCGGRSELAAADCDGHGLCDLVRRRGRTRDLGHACKGRAARRRRRSLRVEPLLDLSRNIFCSSFLSAESPDRRRLLSSAVQPRSRGALCRLHRGLVSRMGGCAVQSVGIDSECGHGWRGESVGRDGDRGGDRPVRPLEGCFLSLFWTSFKSP